MTQIGRKKGNLRLTLIHDDVALDLLIVGGLYSVTALRENDQEMIDDIHAQRRYLGDTLS